MKPSLCHWLLCLALPVFCQYAGDEYGHGAPFGDNQQVQGGDPDPNYPSSYGTAPGYPNSAETAAKKKALAQAVALGALESVLADAAEEQALKKKEDGR